MKVDKLHKEAIDYNEERGEKNAVKHTIFVTSNFHDLIRNPAFAT